MFELPEILVALLRRYWIKQAANWTIGAAAGYSAVAGTQSASGTPGGILDTIWHALTSPVTTILSKFGMNLSQAHKATRSAISHWALAQEKAEAAWYSHLNLLVASTYTAQLDNVNAAADAISRLSLREHTDTHYHDGTHVKTRAASALSHADTAISREHALSSTFTRTHRAQVKLNHHYTQAIDSTLPWALPRTRTRVGELQNDQAKLRERTTSLENGAIKTWEWMKTHPLTAATGAFSLAVAIALQRIGLGNLRCRNFTRMLNKWGCELGTLLDKLLPLAVLLTVAFDFEEFTDAAEVLAQGIGKAVAEIEGTFALQLPPLPPPQG